MQSGLLMHVRTFPLLKGDAVIGVFSFINKFLKQNYVLRVTT